jgi:hypothetical protein
VNERKPNLFFVQGAAHQGKSTLTRHFRDHIDVEVIYTDQVFWRWCDKYHKAETRKVRASLGRYFPHLPGELRREWFEYLANRVIRICATAKRDVVVEGWLLTLLPKDLKEAIRAKSNLMTVTMRKFVAHTRAGTVTVEKRDYKTAVARLRELITKPYGKNR